MELHNEKFDGIVHWTSSWESGKMNEIYIMSLYSYMEIAKLPYRKGDESTRIPGLVFT